MLLVDQDEAQLGQRREHGQSRAKHDACFAGLRLEPVLCALAIGEAAVQADQVHVGETAAEIIFQLRGEVDLGHQQQHLPAALQHFMHQVYVDFGLAAAGDAVQQKTSIAGLLRDCIHRLLLFGSECVRVKENMVAADVRQAGEVFDPARFEQGLQGGGCRRRQVAQLRTT